MIELLLGTTLNRDISPHAAQRRGHRPERAKRAPVRWTAKFDSSPQHARLGRSDYLATGPLCAGQSIFARFLNMTQNSIVPYASPEYWMRPAKNSADDPVTKASISACANVGPKLVK